MSEKNPSAEPSLGSLGYLEKFPELRKEQEEKVKRREELAKNISKHAIAIYQQYRQEQRAKWWKDFRKDVES